MSDRSSTLRSTTGKITASIGSSMLARGHSSIATGIIASISTSRICSTSNTPPRSDTALRTLAGIPTRSGISACPVHSRSVTPTISFELARQCDLGGRPASQRLLTTRGSLALRYSGGMASGRRIGMGLWRGTVFTHRYLGVAVGLLMVMWFATGIVMMYVAYPQISEKERLRTLSPIAWDDCCALDAQKIPDDQPVRIVLIENVGPEPVLRLLPDGGPPRMAALGQAAASFEIDSGRAREIAGAAAGRLMGTSAKTMVADVIDRDQWTVGEDYEGDRPLYHFLFDDPAGTEMYILRSTGRVALWTTASQRFWNWLGAVPHWLYFTELRDNGRLWSQIVIWTSIVAGFLTVIGLTIGILQLKR